jgi:hypothetical protein
MSGILNGRHEQYLNMPYELQVLREATTNCSQGVEIEIVASLTIGLSIESLKALLTF